MKEILRDIARHIDWLTVKLSSGVLVLVTFMDKYDHAMSSLTKWAGYTGVWIGLATIAIRFIKTWKTKDKD